MQPTSQPLHQVLSIEVALETLDAMVSGKRQFDQLVVAQIDDLLRSLPDERADEKLVQGLLAVYRLSHMQTLRAQTAPAILKAVRWARRLNNRPLLAKALSNRAAYASDNYDLAIALEAMLEALNIGMEVGDPHRTAVCYINLSLSMRRLGRYRTAYACMDAALVWLKKISAAYSDLHGHAANVLSDLNLMQGNWRAALDAAKSAKQIYANSTTIEHGVEEKRVCYACAIMNEISARVHLGDLEGARIANDHLLQLVSTYPSERLESYARFASAIYEGFVGNTAQAAKTLAEFKFVPQMRDEALRCLIDIFERAGEADKALDATRELLDGLRVARREVTAADLVQINVASSGDDDVVNELLNRSAILEGEVHRTGDRLNAKLAYLFELGANAELIEEDSGYMGEHIYRVGRLCIALAVEAGCGEEMCWLAEVAGRAHDVGKISLPSQIVLKTEPLRDGEKDVLRSHAEDGAALVAQLSEPRLVQVVAAVRHHHERWDGAGYPSRLRGEEIPLLARIVAVCESFDAMTHSRQFRPARSVASGLQEIERCAGSQFEPRLAGLFVNLVRRLQREHGDLDEYLGEPGRRTRWAKSHPELVRLLEERRTTL